MVPLITNRKANIFVLRQDPTTLLVRYGTNALSSSQYGDMKVSSIRQHANYNSTTISNDISILVLESAIKPSENVKLITVEQTDFIGGEPVQLFGWGLMDGSNQNSIAESLQTAKMNIVSQEECQAVWGEVNAVDAGMICTLHETQSACNVIIIIIGHANIAAPVMMVS